jgi:uncharacterized membrane protein HdeD (DUF308 family)
MKKEKKSKAYLLRLKPKNWGIIILGIVVVGIGFLYLSRGSLTLAPILLVLGYAILIPIGIILK